MAVTWDDKVSSEGPLIADRHIYLDKTGNKIVEQGDAESAQQLVAEGHTIAAADADRLGLSVKNGKVVQDREAKIKDHQALLKDIEGERKSFYEKVKQYQEENGTKDIPNTMEAARVAMETRYEHARLAAAQAIKANEGKDPLLGESQATALRPETSQVAKDATKQVRELVARTPSPQRLAANAPTKRAEEGSAARPANPSEAASDAKNRTAAKTAGTRAAKSAAKKSSGGK